MPLHTGYVASKHALQGFCETLRMELEESGVRLLTVLPHWLRGTDLRKSALASDGAALGEGSRKHSKESVSVEEACAAILRSLRRGKRRLVIPWKLKVLLWLNALRPQLAERLVKGAVTKQND